MIPYVPLSHPFFERLIGTVRRESLDKTLFWNERDLERKLLDFKNYHNRHRTHDALGGVTPTMGAELTENELIDSTTITGSLTVAGFIKHLWRHSG